MPRLTVPGLVAAWAAHNEGGHEGKNDYSRGGVSYEGPTLYSYRMPIARYYKNSFILISNTSPSITTARHISLVHRWANWMKFRVPYIVSPTGGEILQNAHKMNTAALMKELDNMLT